MTTIRRWLESNAEMAQAFASLSKALQRALLPSAEEMDRTCSSVTRSMEKAWACIRDFSGRQQQLADRGWFVSGADFTPKATLLLSRAIDDEQFDEIDQFLSDHADRISERLLLRLHEVSPKRVSIVREAIAAHQEGRYALSVPVLLAQADGLSFEIFRAELFRHKGKQIDRRVQEQLEQVSVLGRPWPITWFEQMFLKPLESTDSLKLSIKKLHQRRQGDPDYEGLNRHEILHGHSVEYGTRPMSARAILLLWYVLEIKKVIGQHEAHAVEMSKKLGGCGKDEEPRD